MNLGPYRDVPSLERRLEYADREIASLRERIKTLEQQCTFRDQQLSAERAAKRQAEILRDDVLRRSREAARPVITTMTATTFPGQWFTEWAQQLTFTPPTYPATVTLAAPSAIPVQPPPQSPDGYGELERRTEAVRAQRAEAYKPAPREKTRFDFLEVD